MAAQLRPQRGFMMIEALVAILIFSLGVLGLVAMGSAAVSTQSDSRFRTDAAALADEIAGAIAFNVDRGTSTSPAVNDASIANSLATFQYQPTGDPASCAFSGGAGVVNPVVTAWVTSVESSTRRLPNAAEQIVVTTTTAGGLNRVQITLCWKGPSDTAMRRHTLVSYVN